MIYAGGTIRIAADLSHRVPVTIGMLVAGGDIVSNASVTVGAALSLRGQHHPEEPALRPQLHSLLRVVPSNDLTLKIPGLDWLNWATEVRYGNYYKKYGYGFGRRHRASSCVFPVCKGGCNEGW